MVNIVSRLLFSFLHIPVTHQATVVVHPDDLLWVRPSVLRGQTAPWLELQGQGVCRTLARYHFLIQM